VLRPEDVVGGVMATLLGDDIRKETGVTVLPGLLDKPGILEKGLRDPLHILICLFFPRRDPRRDVRNKINNYHKHRVAAGLPLLPFLFNGYKTDSIFLGWRHGIKASSYHSYATAVSFSVRSSSVLIIS